jgi:hypothetical protein
MLVRSLAAALVMMVAAASCADVLNIDNIVIGEGSGGTQTPGGMGGQGAASTGGSGQGATTGPGGAGGSGGGPAESCTNGIDDNDDGLTDCEDPLCGTYLCVDEAPTGWSGPYAAHVAATAAACPASAPNEALGGGSGALDVPSANCLQCTCGTPTGVSCSIPSVLHYNETGCDQLEGSFAPATTLQCDTHVSFGAVDAVRGLDTSAASGGMCAPAGGGIDNLPTATFATEARLCGDQVGAGCSAGAVCMPAPEAPFSDKPCILSAGDVPCPAGVYSDRSVVFSGIDDQRDCTGCQCDTPTGVTCSGTSTVYRQPGCGSDMFTVPHDGSCVDTNVEVRSVIYTPDAPSGGGCDDQGGEPTGTATPTGPTTLCCAP